MSRTSSQTFTTSSIAAGTQGTFDVGITGGPSIVNILMIELVPSVTGDGNTTSLELFHSSSRSTSVRYYNAESFPGNLYDPTDNSSGSPALSSWGTPIAADDTDGSGQWHGRITNSGLVAKTYTITIWYEEIQQTASTGVVTFRSGGTFNGSVGIGGAPTGYTGLFVTGTGSNGQAFIDVSGATANLGFINRGAGGHQWTIRGGFTDNTSLDFRDDTSSSDTLILKAGAVGVCTAPQQGIYTLTMPGNNAWIGWRNAANSANIGLFGMDGSDQMIVRGGPGGTYSHILQTNAGATVMTIDASQLVTMTAASDGLFPLTLNYAGSTTKAQLYVDHNGPGFFDQNGTGGLGLFLNTAGSYASLRAGGTENLRVTSTQAMVPTGSAVAPALVSFNFTTTGLYFDSTHLNFSVNGNQQMVISAAGAIAGATDNTQSLGTAALRWANGYFGTLIAAGIATNATGSLYVGSNNSQSNVFDSAQTANDGSYLILRRAEGTQAALANVAAGDIQGSLMWSAYAGGYQSTAIIRATVNASSVIVGGHRPATDLQFYTNIDNGAQTLNMTLFNDGGLVVGSPTGGSKGAGTINVASGIYLNGTAYTNPHGGFEAAYTGKLTLYADRMAKMGLPNYQAMTLNEVEAYTRKHFHFPWMGDDQHNDIFAGGERLLLNVEQLAVGVFGMNHRLESIDEKCQRYERAFARLGMDLATA